MHSKYSIFLLLIQSRFLACTTFIACTYLEYNFYLHLIDAGLSYMSNHLYLLKLLLEILTCMYFCVFNLLLFYIVLDG